MPQWIEGEEFNRADSVLPGFAAMWAMSRRCACFRNTARTGFGESLLAATSLNLRNRGFSMLSLTVTEATQEPSPFIAG